MSATLPNLAGIATADLVQTIGASGFQADYINWSRTMNLLREHAPGWMPQLVLAPDESILHRAPYGAFLLIRFRHMDGTLTEAVPQAIMDARNNALTTEKITARDITDTHRRGVCMAAAFTFGLAYELWAKMPLENQLREPGTSKTPDEQAVLDQQAKRKEEHDEALGRHSESIDFIKDRLAAEDWKAVAQEWADIPQKDQMALWLATTKGGTFSTEQRKLIKSKLPQLDKSPA